MLATFLRDNAELRALEPRHAEEFLAHMDRARDHIKPWVGASFVASDLDGARAVLQRYADGQATDKQRLYGIWLDGTLVGGTMFVSFETSIGVCELGCWLEPGAEGKGLISQVVRMMIDWAFQERGISRAEWRTSPNNARSIAVAKRMGMSLDGTLRQNFPRAESRHDTQVWSALASEWPPTARLEVKAEIDRLTHAFLGAFDNTNGAQPNLDVIRDLFIPQGRIIKNIGAEPVIYDLDGFIAPRQQILTDGTLTEFTEWEVAERTETFGSIAHRFSEYRKAGFLNGARYEGSGQKTTQFVQTADGWKMSSMAWDDV